MNCRRVANELTELEEGSLPLLRRVGLRLHMAVCPGCKVYVRQMDETVGALHEAAEEPLSEEASDELVKRLMQRKY